MKTSTLKVSWLGQTALCLDGARVQPAKPSRKADLLLAYLALNTGISHERSNLMDMLCTNVKDPAGDFRGILKRAREMAGKGITEQFYTIEGANGGSALRFEANPGLRADVFDFRKPFGHAPSIEDLMSKAALYGGSFMPGYEAMDTMGWVERTRAGLDAQFCDLMKRLLDELFAAERWHDLLIWAEHWIARSDLPRDAYSDMLAAYSELGDLPKLEATYKRYVHALDDIGVTPSEDLQRQYDFWRKALLDRYSKPHQSTRPSPTVIPSDLPQAQPPKPMPQPPTSFIGRAGDLAKIAEKLGDAECQLVVLVGIGGVGKTRLALHAAQLASAAFEDGLAYVHLGQVRSDEQFAAALADALSFTRYGQSPLLAQLQNYLREKKLLIVFDSFEHVLQAWNTAPGVADGAQLLDELLNIAPGLKVLVTSRERLNLPREHALPLDGLDYPNGNLRAEDVSDDEIERYGAIKLFLRTARRVRTDFSLQDEKAGVVRICRRARGLPLAIDLAAVHVAGMSAADIADAIDANLDVLEASGAFAEDEDPRHRSVRATFEYSWKMLPQESQKVYAQLSMFAGSFSREAALSVVDAPQHVLSALVGNTLLRYDFRDRRFDMHDLLRQFAADKLLWDGLSEPDLPTRMADYYLSFARRNQNRYTELEPEWGNFLAAMRYAHVQQRWPVVLEFADVLGDAWFMRARFSEAKQGFAFAYDAALKCNDEKAMAHICYAWAITCIEQGEDAVAEDLLAKSQAIQEQQDNWGGVINTLAKRARIKFRMERDDDVRQLCQGVLALQNKTEDVAAVLEALCLLALVEMYAKNLSVARGHCYQALQLGESAENELDRANVLYACSQVCQVDGALTDALKYAQQSYEVYVRLGQLRRQANVLLQLSTIYGDNGEDDTALMNAQKALELYRLMHDRWSMVNVLIHMGDVYTRMGQTDLAKKAWRDGLTIGESLHHPRIAELVKRLAS